MPGAKPELDEKSKMLGKIKKLIGKYERIDNPRPKREMTAEQKQALVERLSKGREASKMAKTQQQ